AYNGTDSLQGTVSLAPFTTDDLVEGINPSRLYYTQTRVDDRIFTHLSAKIIAGNNITIQDDLPYGWLTISSAFNGPNTFEEVDDRVAALIQNGTGLSWTYLDGSNQLVGNVTLSPFTTTNLAEGSNLYFTNERVDDRVAALLQAGPNIQLNYDD